MKYLIIFFIIMTSTITSAKRKAPSEIPSIIFKGKKYIVTHWNKEPAFKQNGGIIEVWNIKKNRLIKRVLIYKIQYKSEIESDIQDVFITSIKLNKSKNTIIIVNEKGNIYGLNIHNYKVTRIK